VSLLAPALLLLPSVLQLVELASPQERLQARQARGLQLGPRSTHPPSNRGQQEQQQQLQLHHLQRTLLGLLHPLAGVQRQQQLASLASLGLLFSKIGISSRPSSCLAERARMTAHSSSSSSSLPLVLQRVMSACKSSRRHGMQAQPLEDERCMPRSAEDSQQRCSSSISRRALGQPGHLRPHSSLEQQQQQQQAPRSVFL
jgi:hypothetical protein